MRLAQGGCAQPRALSEDGVPGYGHAKVLAGLTDIHDYRKRAPPRFDVLSSEQRELAEALQMLGPRTGSSSGP